MAGKQFRLTNAPLIHVLIQVVVDPYLKVGTRIPDLQEALRPLGFVDFQEAHQQHLNVDVESGQLQVGLTKLWYFFTKDRTTRLCVGSHSVVLQRTVHTHFNEMKDLLLEVIRETGRVWPDGHQVRRRLGLRYVNLVIPHDSSHPPLRLIAPGFHGLAGLQSGSRSYSRVESVLEREPGQVAVRYSDLPGQPPLPPGIDPMGMRQRIPPQGVAFGILDIDRFEESEKSFDPQELDRDLSIFNQDAEQALLASCTEDALQEWGYHEID